MDTKARTQIVNMRVRPTEAELIRSCADAVGLTVSDWMRKAAMKQAARVAMERFANGTAGNGHQAA